MNQTTAENNFLSVFARKEASRFKLKTGVFLLLIQNNHLLLSKRYKTGIDDGKYSVPAGAIDGNETVTQTVIREAREEANIILKPDQIQMCHVMHRLHYMPENLSFEQIDFFFLAETYEGVLANNEPEKCSELAFYPLDNLPTPFTPHISHALEALARKEFFSEFGWPQK